MKSHIKVYDVKDYFNDFDCKHLIDLFNDEANIEHHDTPGYKFDQVNVNKVLPFMAKDFAKMCNKLAIQYFKSLNIYDYIPEYGFEEVRIKRYSANDGGFKPHVDVVDHASAKRFLTFIMYLNDNDGYTRFTNLDLQVKPTMGTMLVFPPTWMFPHSGETPTSGEKFIMMTSLTYL
jgi:hypothetical protein